MSNDRTLNLREQRSTLTTSGIDLEQIYWRPAVKPLQLLILVLCLPASSASAEETFVAFWNVENLFDTVDDPNVEGDEEFTPTGPNKWTEERLAIKLANLTKVISKMNGGKGPDVLGLAEIENRKVIELLIAKLQPLGRDYKIVHKDSPSGRGIDCGLIYDAKVFTEVSSKFHHVEAETTRDIVEAELKRGDASLFVFVNHWPARSHPESFRVTAGKTLRTRIDQILAADPETDILAIGDFNDHPTDEGIKTTLGTVAAASEAVGGKLLNTSFSTTPDATNGTYVYKNKWEIIDQIVLSPGLLKAPGFRWKEGSSKTLLVMPEQLFDPSGSAIPRPNRSYSGPIFHATGI